MSVHTAGIIRGRRANSFQLVPNQEGQHSTSSGDGDNSLDQLSVLSIGSETPNESLLTNLLRTTDKLKQPKPLNRPTIHLSEVTSTIDKEQSFVGDNKEKILNKLEEEWNKISQNFNTVVNHLENCCNQVTSASTACLQSLVDSVETSCDLVDQEVNALYHLISKCDELTTKLSIAASFSEEIRALKNSVDTLDTLYKTTTKPNKSTISFRAPFLR